MRGKLAELSLEEKDSASTRLCEQILQDAGLRKSKSLGIFLSLPDEPNLRPALQILQREGCRLALPFPNEDSTWAFHWISGLEGTAQGPWGLEMPLKGDAVSAADLEAILVPGRAFTRDGQRIGRGKGIYDRLLSSPCARRIGFGFACQLQETLPQEAHDSGLDEVWLA